jgi:hypothetical protein
MLLEVHGRLSDAGIVHSLGGSGLLAAHGLVDRVRDWDLTTDATLDRLLPVVDELRPAYVGSSGRHSDSKLVFDGGTVELIVRFALVNENRVARIPTFVRGAWEGIPLGSLEAWAVAYALMERTHRSEPMFLHLESRGADASALHRLLREPLPEPLARRLAALRRVSGTGSARPGPPSS